MVKGKETAMKSDEPERPGAAARITIAVRRRGTRYVAELKERPDGQPLFTGRADRKVSACKRDVERILGPLEWRDPTDFDLRDPDILQAAQLELD